METTRTPTRARVRLPALLTLAVLGGACGASAESSTTATAPATVPTSIATAPSTTVCTAPANYERLPVATLPWCSGPDVLPAPVPGEDPGDFMVRCFAEWGIVVFNLKREFPDHQFTSGLQLWAPDGQPYAPEANHTCYRILQDHGLAYDEDDPQQLAQMYQVLLDLLRCLDEHGYPAFDPPSEEVWMETKGDYDPFLGMGIWSALDATKDCPTEFPGGVGDMRNLDLQSLIER